jgi:two-component system cell cycle response regulator DivK
MLNDFVYVYVEDDPMSRDIMHRLMTKALMIEHFTAFSDSQYIMARLHALNPHPNVILLDIHMKPHTGFEVLEFVRQDALFRDAKVIALTASVMNEEVLRLRECGFNGAIAKPISRQSFPALLERIVRGDTVWHII